MNDGCPIGYGGIGCEACSVGTYKNTTLGTMCRSCPMLTTTATRGAVSMNECLLCGGTNTQTQNGTCFVDLNNNFTTKWTCIGTYGSRCATPCPGGADSPCTNNGKCESGPKASGNWYVVLSPSGYIFSRVQNSCLHVSFFPFFFLSTCELNFYGHDCSGTCDCGSGKCNEGATGDGTCVCTVFY